MNNILITANSPGEIEGWLKPVVKELKKIRSDINITVFIPPCRYSSGEEEKVIKRIKEVNGVLNKKDFFKFLLGIGGSLKIDKKNNGVVVFLGGDIIFALLLKWKTKWPLIGYGDSLKPWPWNKFFNKFLTKKDIGNIMIDAFLKNTEGKGENIKDKKNKKIMLFPGSRKEHFKAFLPLLIEAGRILKKNRQDIDLFLKTSPYISDNIKDELLSSYNLTDFILMKNNDMDYFDEIDLLVTLPGTSTFQAAVRQVPMLVILPFNRPELIQYDGILGMATNIPLIKKYAKKIVLYFANKFIKFIALPNIECNSEVVPEIRKNISEAMLAEEIIKLIDNDEGLAAMRKNLKDIIGKSGASKLFCNEVMTLLEGHK